MAPAEPWMGPLRLIRIQGDRMADEQPPAPRSRTTSSRTARSRRPRLQGAQPGRRPVPLRRGRPGLAGVLGPPGGRARSTGTRSGTRSASGSCPFAKWFVGGKLNVSPQRLDRHVAAGHGDKVAYHWEGEPGDTRTITYADLLAEVQRFANVLKGLGVAEGRPRRASTCR